MMRCWRRSIEKVFSISQIIRQNASTKKKHLMNDTFSKLNYGIHSIIVHDLPKLHPKLDNFIIDSPCHFLQFSDKRLNIINTIQFRTYSTTGRKSPLPLLTDLEIHETPSLFGDVNCFLITYSSIKPQLDPDFNLREFLMTSNKVVAIVSKKLATKDFESLQEIVTPNTFEQLKKNLLRFTETELQELVINPSDILTSFIYKMFISEDADHGLKYLSIITGHHFIPRLEDIKKQFADINPFQVLEQNLPSPPTVYVVNYKFLRTFNIKTGQASDWIINGLNYKKNEP